MNIVYISHLKFILDNTIFIWLSWLEINWLFCFGCFFVPKIDVRIGTGQELEEVDVKYFSMAPPARWVMVYRILIDVSGAILSLTYLSFVRNFLHLHSNSNHPPRSFGLRRVLLRGFFQ